MKHAEFAFPGPLRDKLVAAILRGEKTSTTGLVVEYEKYGEELPVVGERELMIDSAGEGLAILETTEVRVIPLSEVDLQHAIDEGEGFTSVAEWRAGHTDYWQGAEMRAALEDPKFTVDDTTQVVATRFVIVTVFPKERIG
ncbi:ASCH domain-containing protein [Amycolatopsis sp. NPDC048633]|uniref:ASCH domain-containing protein n=1 Tax=Amycolatopsis sp. NPDC048633 TaxID=3157095 RepID=UPI0033FB4969